MKTLNQLYEEHSGKVSDKWSIYLSEYDGLLTPYRERPRVDLLEIGIQNGGSLDIWSEYFKGPGSLVGCDINESCGRLTYSDPRISVVVGDANVDATERQIAALAERFDIIIDDGSHTSGDIVKSFLRYFPRLKDGGIFIAEDLHCSYWQEFDGGLYHPYSSISFFKLLVDVINGEHWGIDRRAGELLGGFYERYQYRPSSNLLSSVHSVEFVNSLCIVRKAPAYENVLGRRVVVGQEEAAQPGILSLASQTTANTTMDQRTNFWSMLAQSPSELWQELQSQTDELRAEKEGLQSENVLLRNLVADKAEQISCLQQECVRRERHISTLLQKLVRRERQMANLRIVATGYDARIEGLQLDIAKLDADVAKYRGDIGAMLRSTSWRLTAPVRWSKTQAIRIASRLQRKVGRVSGSSLVGAVGPEQSMSSHPAATLNYAEWIRRYDTVDDETRSAIRQYIAILENPPLISVLMPTFNPHRDWLIAAVESVRNQLYPNWELCIADDASTDPEVRPLLEDISRQDERVKVVFREQNGHIAAASNSALAVARGDWIALLDHDDILPEHALYCVAVAIVENPSVALIYSDEDKIDAVGRRHDPYFKCDWNVDLFYSQNMFSHLGIYKTSLVQEVGGFKLGTEGSQDYDLALRCIEKIEASAIFHIPRVLYHWRVHSESTAGGVDAKPYAALAGERALNEHFARQGVQCVAEWLGYGYRARYSMPNKPPLVTLIIPTRNAVGLVRQCIESIFTKTTYQNYEIIIVDNGSDDPEALDYLASLSADDRIRVTRDDSPFNYSALNNRAVEQAKGSLVCLVNNDIEVISPDWLSEMVSLAVQPQVGAVGAKLYYPDDTVQHGGVVLGVGGVGSHSHKHAPKASNGYFGRVGLVSSFSAVTAACLLIRKSVYQQVGGLNEVDLTIAFNDVDFCLRVREAGYRNVWTPYAELYHHESATRGSEDNPQKQARFNAEVAYMLRRWDHILQTDPAYSPNLTLDRDDFGLAWPPRISALA
jgi:GT2 family glycosyltransferase